MSTRRLLYIGNKLSSKGKTPTGIEILGPLLEQEGFVLQYASSKKGKVVRLLDMMMALLRHAPASDFVLIDTYSTYNFWFAVMSAGICRMLRKPYIPILHGGNLPQRLSSSPGLSRFLFGHAYANVAPSSYLAHAFEKAGFQVSVIPNPLLEAISFVPRSTFRPRLLWVRSFVGIYNPEMAIEVLRIVSDRHKDVSLVMVGPEVDPTAKSCRDLAASYKLDVTFTGKLAKSDWMAMASDSDFFINTSNVDNSPFSLVEAAALGLPVISTDVGGIPHLFEHAVSARLVPKGDAQAMADEIENLLHDPNLAQSMIREAKRIPQAAKWEHLRTKWLEILK